VYLATHKSAIKRNRQSLARRSRNVAYKTKAKTAIIEVGLAIANKDVEAARVSLRKTASILQKIQSKGVIHKNNASRKISRLARDVNKLAAVSSEGGKAAPTDSPEQDPPSSQS
jgi:small subunit ribosomal protein S20